MKNHHAYILGIISSLSQNQIFAEADLSGSSICPSINGATVFYRHPKENGIFVVSTVFGLPDNDRICSYEMHVRGGHFPSRLAYNESLNNLARGFSRDMLTLPDIRGNGGFAFSVFYTEEIAGCDLLGRTVSIFPKTASRLAHEEALACGLIMPPGSDTSH